LVQINALSYDTPHVLFCYVFVSPRFIHVNIPGLPVQCTEVTLVWRTPPFCWWYLFYLEISHRFNWRWWHLPVVGLLQWSFLQPEFVPLRRQVQSAGIR